MLAQTGIVLSFFQRLGEITTRKRTALTRSRETFMPTPDFTIESIESALSAISYIL